MHSRLRELVREAGLDDPDFSIEDWDNIPLAKFAELIVKECATYMNGRTEDWDAKLRWIFNDGSGYMEVDVDSLLNEHFGVEE